MVRGVNLMNMPGTGSERQVLLASLHNQRVLMHWKLDGLTPTQAGQMLTPSLTNLLGVVKHLAFVERWWFVTMFKGEDFDHPYDFDSDPDAEFHPQPSDTVDSVLADYDAAIATADAIVAEAGLDDVAGRRRQKNDEALSLRWILIHMIEETARHAGHADIVRELIDGATGYLPPDD